MWHHYCPCEEVVLGNLLGEPCNWCDAPESQPDPTSGVFTSVFAASGATTGTKIVTIRHSLGFAPAAARIAARLIGGGDNFRYLSLKVRSVSSTEISVMFEITVVPISDVTVIVDVGASNLPGLS